MIYRVPSNTNYSGILWRILVEIIHPFTCWVLGKFTRKDLQFSLGQGILHACAYLRKCYRAASKLAVLVHDEGSRCRIWMDKALLWRVDSSTNQTHVLTLSDSLPSPSFSPFTDGMVGKLLVSNILTTKIPKVVSKPIIFSLTDCLMEFCISCYMKYKKICWMSPPKMLYFILFTPHIPFNLWNAGLNDTLVEQMKTIRTFRSETAWAL